MIAHTEAGTQAELPRFIKDEFDAFLECGILAHGLLRLRYGGCGHDKLLAFSCKLSGSCPSCGTPRISQTAARLVDHVAAQPEPVTPVLRVAPIVRSPKRVHALARHCVGLHCAQLRKARLKAFASS